MRTLLRRLLLASWLIPAAWLIIWPLIWLLEGNNGATKSTVGFCRDIWDGLESWK